MNNAIVVVGRTLHTANGGPQFVLGRVISLARTQIDTILAIRMPTNVQGSHDTCAVGFRFRVDETDWWKGRVVMVMAVLTVKPFENGAHCGRV